MSSSSLREPKAPIVRIRKKKTKKKVKENDIVHLPVRASQQTRYASLTTPQNPQTKGRECCRTVFASCLKLPVCKTICFRCILPQCYNGEGSDDEEPEARDEGYHSQNRHSSELPIIAETPQAAASQGAVGGGRDVEMTELKTEAVKLVPPPRRPVNDYRRGPSGSRERLSAPEGSGEITYIEVESISFQSRSDRSSTRERSGSRSSASGTCQEMDAEGYEEPVLAGVLGEELSVGIERELKSRSLARDIGEFLPVSLIRSDASKTSVSEYDGDSDDSETKYYVNEDILKRPATATGCDPKLKLTKTVSSKQKALDYANVSADKSSHVPQESLHSTQSETVTRELTSAVQETAEESHEYINVDTLDSIVITTSGQERETKIAIPEGMVLTSSVKASTGSLVDAKKPCGSTDEAVAETRAKEEAKTSNTVILPTQISDETDDEANDADDEVISDKKVLLDTNRTRVDNEKDSRNVVDPRAGNDEDLADDLDTDKTKLIG